MSCNLVIPISGSECIGDSRVKINNNFDSLCNALTNLSGNILTPITTPTVVSFFDTTTRRLSSFVRNDSITTDQLANNAVTTAKLSAGVVTTDKIALSAITNDKIALSAVTADKINLVTSLGSNGYQIMPGGLIMQWGESGSLASDGNQTLNFPIPFPNSCLKAFVTIKNSSTTNDDSFARVISYNSTQIVVRSEYSGGGGISGTRSIDYLAIGY